MLRKTEGLGGEVVGDVVKNSPGKRRLVPYTSSAAAELMSCLSEVLISRKTSGGDVIQSSGFDVLSMQLSSDDGNVQPCHLIEGGTK